ncbi:DUF2252 domain-containing protein [Agromyces atrinae]|uniref:DUF2252 domain-containing protein n=1 Tax=Agromyces atrinae TaxID=592376 RepID=A0A4Q2M3V9_9MICO|nr:DUF2252 domain-containing protein [Agromyces atrinae]NYD66403.1 uncharacterized protein (DUF2252 family) [Agromyces atrinae]RXZ86715.1 DUF2252 domain-containing protein [Agromyces atrinae]
MNAHAGAAAGTLRLDHAHVTTHDERDAAGRAARADLTRSSHARYSPAPERDPLGILEQQHRERLPDLVPLRVARMAASPFAFYRGTAALQAADFANEPNTGHFVVSCGDAHISNFGMFSAPNRSLVFDLNDFDEAAFGPWEWDVKRLVTSVVIAARSKGYSPEAARADALGAARGYREFLRGALKRDPVSRYYLRAEVHGGRAFGSATQKAVRQVEKAAAKRTSARAFAKITEVADDGSMHIIEAPPTLTHVSAELEERLSELVDEYRRTVSPDIALLLSQYTATDVARRVVGVGSVGTRCFIVVFTGPNGEPLILQVKQATESVLHEFGGLPPHASAALDPELSALHHGYRVVSNQRILQAASDPFLGYLTVAGRGFYVRQFRDGNASFDIETLKAEPFTDYVTSCGAMLARAHAQSPEAAFIAGYLGGGTAFDEAVVEWAFAYADQSLADYEAFRTAIDAGRFTALDTV